MRDVRKPELWVGLQEWAVTCQALAAGELTCVVRKGGIHEPQGGTFELQQPRFLLLPTYLHQDPERLHPHWRAGFDTAGRDPDSGAFVIEHWAEVGAVWKVVQPRVLEALGPRVPWTSEELMRRFRYRGDPWLAVVAVRVHRMAAPVRVPFKPEYQGCRSWVPLGEPVAIAGSTPVCDEPTWAARLEELTSLLAAQEST
ncbi:MAG: DUF1802 family protein [Planctomycetota bacterium]|jgi:hypothetical protein|nr:DUF1802 family protein [Planctomycetota bacterium]